MFSLVSSSRLTFNFHHCHSSVFASPPLISPPAPSFQPHTPSPLPSTPPFLELCSPSLSLSCPRKGGQRCFGFNWQPQNHNKVLLILRLNIYVFRYSKVSLEKEQFPQKVANSHEKSLADCATVERLDILRLGGTK